MKFDFLKDMAERRQADALGLFDGRTQRDAHRRAGCSFIANGAPVDQVALDPLIARRG